MMVVTGEMGLGREVGSHIDFPCEGHVVEEGPSEETLTSPKNPRTKEFLSAVLKH